MWPIDQSPKHHTLQGGVCQPRAVSHVSIAFPTGFAQSGADDEAFDLWPPRVGLVAEELRGLQEFLAMLLLPQLHLAHESITRPIRSQGDKPTNIIASSHIWFRAPSRITRLRDWLTAGQNVPAQARQMEQPFHETAVHVALFRVAAKWTL